MGSSCENSALGVTRNPYDPSRVPGGSCGGSAAAVAAYEAAIGLGSDTGGSIREPAAFCNLVGFKPTYGRVSRYGLIAFASSLDQIGPLDADGRRCGPRLRCDGRLRSDGRDLDRPCRRDRRQTRCVPIPRPAGRHRQRVRYGALGAEMRRGLREAYRDLERLGAELVEVALPTADYGVATYYLIAPAECSSNLARFDGVRYGLRVDGADVGADVRQDARRRLRPRGEAPHPDRDLRALERILRRLLRARAEGAHADRRRLRARVRRVRPDRVPGRELARPSNSTPRAIRTACI